MGGGLSGENGEVVTKDVVKKDNHGDTDIVTILYLWMAANIAQPGYNTKMKKRCIKIFLIGKFPTINPVTVLGPIWNIFETFLTKQKVTKLNQYF